MQSLRSTAVIKPLVTAASTWAENGKAPTVSTTDIQEEAFMAEMVDFERHASDPRTPEAFLLIFYLGR